VVAPASYSVPSRMSANASGTVGGSGRTIALTLTASYAGSRSTAVASIPHSSRPRPLAAQSHLSS
jgi:hypothetical protein